MTRLGESMQKMPANAQQNNKQELHHFEVRWTTGALSIWSWQKTKKTRYIM